MPVIEKIELDSRPARAYNIRMRMSVREREDTVMSEKRMSVH